MAVIQWKVAVITCFGSILSPGEQEGYGNTMSDGTIRKNRLCFSHILKRNKKKKYLEKKYLLALPYGSELEVPKLHNLNHSWMVIKILFRSTPAPILT